MPIRPESCLRDWSPASYNDEHNWERQLAVPWSLRIIQSSAYFVDNAKAGSARLRTPSFFRKRAPKIGAEMEPVLGAAWNVHQLWPDISGGPVFGPKNGPRFGVRILSTPSPASVSLCSPFVPYPCNAMCKA